MNQEKSFGAFVRQRRREMDLTQEELARRVGCAAITLRKIEADDLRASVQIAERLAMALAIPLEERAEFVRWARSVRPAASELPPVTPPPSMEEIGREDLTGRAIRGYALAERIGMGGMGSVYRAVQPNVDREVAVKIILPAFANHPDFIRRFEAEAQLVARLEHPHIVPLYDYWREPGVAYLVMRLLRGGNVQHLLEQGPLALDTVIGMLDQICSALNAAHRIGVIHRDLKPANVLLDEDNNAYLADFGIAKNLGNPDLESQTQTDAVIGSPQYMSPEQIRSLSVRPQTDVYCLGVMLYEMLTGVLPFTGPTPWEIFQQHVNTPMPPLSAHRSGLPSALDAVIARATAKDPDARYTDTLSLLQDFRQALGHAVGEPVHVIEYDEEDTEAITTNPFKGLRAFGEADAENFFGRETLVQQLLARLAEGGELSRFLAVIGPSGSGKSSVVRAGLIPALRRGGLPGSENWFVVDMMPGKRPFEELEASLLRVAVNPPESLLSQLKDGNRGLLRAVHRILPADETVELVLVIDQFEEVFTLVEDESERALLLESLTVAMLDERSRLRVILTLRADFTDRPLRYVDFGEMMERRFEFVLPLTPDEVERAIAGPAQRVGLKLEKGLVSTIIRDTGDQPGTLPLLQYALSELFERREGRLLSNKAYKEIGGVLGALGRSAEKVFSELSDTDQAVARQLFLRLVTLGEGTEDTRRRVLRTELEGLSPAVGSTKEDWSAVIDRFGRARLLSFDRDPITRGGTVEVAHEALLREWSRLREWLNESRSDVRLQRQLATAASEWQNANCDESFLMTGARLEQFEGWVANTSLGLTQDERSFLDTSITVRDRHASEEHARQQRELEAAQRLAETERQSVVRLRTRNRLITVVGIVAIVLAILAASFGISSNRNASSAFNAQATAQADAQSRATAEADAINERNEAQRQSLIASVRELSSEANLSLATDPERSILIALQAAEQTYSVDGTVLPEAEYALRRAVLASRVELTIREHTDTVWAVTYSPDGTRIASSSQDGTAVVWEAATGRKLFNLSGHQGDVFGVAFSPDGTLLVTAGGDGTARIWDAATGEQRLTLIGHSGEVFFAVFSPDQKLIATAGTDGTARIWNAATGEQLLVLHEGNAETILNQVDFSPDGKRIVLACEDGEAGWASVWDTSTGEKLYQLEGHTVQVRSATFSPDGTRLVTGSADRTVKIWDASDGRELLTLYGNTDVLSSVDFSPDSSRVVTAGWDRIIRVWDATTGQQLFNLAGHSNRIWSAAFSPDGTKVVTGGGDNTIRVWRLTPTRELLTVVNEPSLPSPAPAWVAYSPDGTRIATSNVNPSPEVWDVESGTRLFKLIGHSQIVRGLVYSADGSLIATASDDRSVKLWDARTGQEVRTIPTSHQDVVVSVALSPDGTQAATGSFDGTAKTWDASNGQQLLTLAGHGEGVVHVTFSPDGKRLATASFDGTAIVWDVESGKALMTLIGHNEALRQVSFSSDGKRLVTASFDGTAKVWDAETGKEIVTLIGHTALVFSAVFNPDDKTIATGSPDGTAKIWDAETGQELLTLESDISGVTNVAFSPDGSRLVTANRDGTNRIFLLRIEDLMALAKKRVTRSLTLDECQQFLHMSTCPALP